MTDGSCPRGPGSNRVATQMARPGAGAWPDRAMTSRPPGKGKGGGQSDQLSTERARRDTLVVVMVAVVRSG